MVKLFGSNNDVSFGDVNLSSDSVRSSHGTPQSPGAGGWPTVRYFNKATGYGGAPYAKRTSDPMCTELGPGKPYLQEYIETAGTTALCSVATSDGCSDRQRTYVEKMKAKGGDEVAKQLARLGKMAAGENKMKPELKLWLAQRIGILRQLGPKDEL